MLTEYGRKSHDSRNNCFYIGKESLRDGRKVIIMVFGFNNGFVNSVNAINPIGNPYMMGAYGMMGMNPYTAQLNFTGRQDMKNFYNAKMDDYQSGIHASGMGRTSQKAFAVANALKGALANGNDTEVGMYLRNIENDEHLLAGVELAYDKMAGGRTAFRQDLRNELAGDKSALGFVSEAWHAVTSPVARAFGYDPISEKEAIDIVNQGAKVNTTVAANALKDATLGQGTDEKTVDFILDSHRGRMNEINMSYNQMGDLTSDIRNDYHGLVDGFGTEERLTSQVVGAMFE